MKESKSGSEEKWNVERCGFYGFSVFTEFIALCWSLWLIHWELDRDRDRDRDREKWHTVNITWTFWHCTRTGTMDGTNGFPSYFCIFPCPSEGTFSRSLCGSFPFPLYELFPVTVPFKFYVNKTLTKTATASWLPPRATTEQRKQGVWMFIFLHMEFTFDHKF